MPRPPREDFGGCKGEVGVSNPPGVPCDHCLGVAHSPIYRSQPARSDLVSSRKAGGKRPRPTSTQDENDWVKAEVASSVYERL